MSLHSSGQRGPGPTQCVNSGKASGGGRFPRPWANEKRRAPGTIGSARHSRETKGDERGQLAGSAPQLRGFDAVVVPRWLTWTGLSRGAQLLLVRLCSPAARGVRQRCKRCQCGRCKKHGGKLRRDPRAPVQRAKGGLGFVKRPLRWFADLLGLRSTRQASNILRELEGTPFLWRRHIKPGGTTGGTELEVWLNLERWFRNVPKWQRQRLRAETGFRDRTLLPSRRGRERGTGRSLEGVRASQTGAEAFEAERKQHLATFAQRDPP